MSKPKPIEKLRARMELYSQKLRILAIDLRDEESASDVVRDIICNEIYELMKDVSMLEYLIDEIERINPQFWE